MHEPIPPPSKLSLDEILNSTTHAAGAIFGAVGLILMISYTWELGEPFKTGSAIVYGASLTFTFLASTVYHLMIHPRKKYIFRIIDHAAIFILIGGSYTPFTLVAMRDNGGWVLFSIAWGLALIGIVFKLFFIKSPRWISAIIYLLMGWMVVFAFGPLQASLPEACLWWVAIGGLLFSLGVPVYLWKKLPYNHAIWHIFVLGGAVAHFVAVYNYVLRL